MNTKIIEYLNNLTAIMPGYVYWKDKSGVFLGCNDLLAKLAGLSSGQQVIGKTDYDLCWKENADAIKRSDLEVIKTGISQTVEEILTLNDDSRVIFLSSKTALYDDEERVIAILCVASDVTKYKQQENELRASINKTETTLENILNNIPAHIFWKDSNCILLGCNDLQAKNMGFSSGKEMVGKTNYDVIWPNQPEADRKIQADAITKIDLEVIASGKTYTAEEPLVLPDGTTAIYLSKKTPLRNEKGEVVGILGVSFDITDKKKTELELLETRQRLEGMTLVGASIAHELRTPLAAFDIARDCLKDAFPHLREGYLWAKERGAPIEDFSEKYLLHLEKSLADMKTEIRSAFTFIDISLMKTKLDLEIRRPEIFSIGDSIDDALSRYPFTAEQHNIVQWKNNMDADFLINADKLLITHVLFNLLKNALYYLAAASKDTKGGIQIWLERGNLFNKLYFKDVGAGIAPDNLPHIFERFFSKTRNGAGVGLTFCKTVMESIKGNITCESIEGEYTLFVLSFPVNM